MNSESNTCSETVSNDYINALPYPVMFTDDNGKIVFKNETAYKLKIANVGTNFKAILAKGQEEIFLDAIRTRKAMILKCKTEKGVTHAAFIPSDDGKNIVFLVLCSMAVQKIYDMGEIELMYQTFKVNDMLLQTYKDMCEKYKLVCDEKSSELIKNNSLRFSRVSRMMSMYIHTLTRTETFETPKAHDLRFICTKLIEHFSSKVNPLGFRLNISFEDRYLPTVIQKNTFVTVFLELCAIALRIAEDFKCMIKMYKSETEIFVDFDISTSSGELASAAYALELEFVKIICNYCKWTFGGLKYRGNYASLSFSVPIVIDFNATISCPDFFEGTPADKMFEISDAMASALYFM